MGKDTKMINETHDSGAGDVLKETTEDMKEFDMNVLNNPVTSDKKGK
jgi:hypothetical protein